MIAKSFPLTAVPETNKALLKSSFFWLGSNVVEMAPQENLLMVINLLLHYGNSANLHPD